MPVSEKSCESAVEVADFLLIDYIRPHISTRKEACNLHPWEKQANSGLCGYLATCLPVRLGINAYIPIYMVSCRKRVSWVLASLGHSIKGATHSVSSCLLRAGTVGGKTQQMFLA